MRETRGTQQPSWSLQEHLLSGGNGGAQSWELTHTVVSAGERELHVEGACLERIRIKR